MAKTILSPIEGPIWQTIFDFPALGECPYVQRHFLWLDLMMRSRIDCQARFKQLWPLGRIVAVASNARVPGTGHDLKAEV